MGSGNVFAANLSLRISLLGWGVTEGLHIGNPIRENSLSLIKDPWAHQGDVSQNVDVMGMLTVNDHLDKNNNFFFLLLGCAGQGSHGDDDLCLCCGNHTYAFRHKVA